MRTNPGRNNQGTGAQELLNFVKDFTENHGRFPKLRELPVKKVTVVYHFGSYETLLQIARMGEKDLPLRKGRKKRYCRYCGRILPRHRWFFCVPTVDGNGNTCEDKFAEQNSHILTEDEAKKHIGELDILRENYNGQKSKRRVGKKMWHKCKACKEKCKIYLPEYLTEPPCLFICKADPEYEEINEKLSKGL